MPNSNLVHCHATAVYITFVTNTTNASPYSSFIAAELACATSKSAEADTGCLGEYGLTLDEACAVGFSDALSVDATELRRLSAAHRELHAACRAHSDAVCYQIAWQQQWCTCFVGRSRWQDRTCVSQLRPSRRPMTTFSCDACCMVSGLPPQTSRISNVSVCESDVVLQCTATAWHVLCWDVCLMLACAVYSLLNPQLN
jgi:hypothetical protein